MSHFERSRSSLPSARTSSFSDRSPGSPPGARADGILAKGAGARDLFSAIRLVYAGEQVLPPISAKVLEEASEDLLGDDRALVGMLLDGGGVDGYDDRQWTVGVALGSGHDYSLGVLVDESGDDRYYGAGNGLGDGNCNGIGILVDNAGLDTWQSLTPASLGHAHLSGECLRREGALTGAIFIDAAGDDEYVRPATDPLADDGASFPQSDGYDGEHGAFVDAADGDSRLPAPLDGSRDGTSCLLDQRRVPDAVSQPPAPLRGAAFRRTGR